MPFSIPSFLLNLVKQNQNCEMTVPLVMKMENLSQIPKPTIPPGYTSRNFQPGDEQAWDHIIAKSFKHSPSERFNDLLRSDQSFHPQRIWFICNNQIPVATASAWHFPEYGFNTGYLHMVGVLPEEMSKGLGTQISLIALQQMKREGKSQAILKTDPFRIPAINLYLKIGFSPLLVHESQRKIWQEILTQLNREDLKEKFKPILQGPITNPESPPTQTRLFSLLKPWKKRPKFS